MRSSKWGGDRGFRLTYFYIQGQNTNLWQGISLTTRDDCVWRPKMIFYLRGESSALFTFSVIIFQENNMKLFSKVNFSRK